MPVVVSHGEGRAEFDSAAQQADALVAMRYVSNAGQPTELYPANPNGSPLGIAGLTDPSGRILGLMPHPEAYNHPTNHPRWTRGETSTLGTALLQGGIEYLKGL